MSKDDKHDDRRDDDRDEPPVGPVEPPSIADEWADDYPPGTELFVAAFDADDFDDVYGENEYPEGSTLAVMRCSHKPQPGWVRKHAHMSDLERTFALIEMHASERALAILDDLKEGPWNDFIDKWGRDGGLIQGKSARSARRSGK